MSKPEQYYVRHRSEMRAFLPEQYSNVLEIGCGEGNFRGNLDGDHEYWGVEPSPAAAENATEKLDKVLVGTYEDVADQVPDDYFDLVICNDVIEHMPDHNAFLQAIKQKLKRDACLMVSVPNVRYVSNLFEILVRKDWKYMNEGTLDYTHMRFFTEKSLKRTISENGYVIERFQGLNPFRRRSFLRWCFYYASIILFGRDVRFLQFGVRMKYDSSR